MHRILLVIALLPIVSCATARGGLPASEPFIQRALHQPDEWYKSDEARQLADHLVTWQNPNGGWWKKYDPREPRPTSIPAADVHDAPAGDTEDIWRHTSTFDNGSTYTEMRILARANRAGPQQSYQDAFNRGLKFIFDSQYPNGGWSQRFPLENNYGRRITFNDDAMTNVMRLLKDVAASAPEFSFVGDDDRRRCKESLDRGIDCTLKCQVKSRGKLTAWAQQYDEVTLAPASARAYELPSISPAESTGIVLLLMDLEKPDQRVRRAVDAAMAWFDAVKITGKRVQTVTGPQYENGRDRILVDDPAAGPLWARFYDLETGEPFFCSRDGLKRKSIAEISHERRNGYSWYGAWPLKAQAAYADWKQRVAASQPSASVSKKTLTVGADGGAQFKTVQDAIDSLTPFNAVPAEIDISPGVYKQHLVVPRDKSLITLRGMGEDPSKVVLTNDWNASTVPSGASQPVGTSGSASTTVDADDFTTENLTFENTAGDHGQAVALKTTGDRAVIRNCRLLGWQDTLCADAGRQYFDRCYIEGRVDFLFGGATAVFDHCKIHSKNGGHVTAARTPRENKFGYVFLDCTLTGEGAPADLGRPWQWDRGRRAAVALVRCRIGSHIKPEGWNKWDLKDKPNEHPEQTTRYSEFASTDLDGKPLDVSGRVGWAHQLTAEQAAEYTVQNILGGTDHWDPTAATGAQSR